nr:AAA family ATPase [Microlunatus panaciterrae]
MINGAPASGKSTLARRYADAHPLTLVLDIDEIRGMLGGWFDRAGEAGLRARALAVAMARVQLAAGQDVVVPQLLGRLPFVLELERVAEETGSTFVEIALLNSPEETVARFARRSEQAASPTHRDATALVERAGGEELLRDYYAAVLDVVRSRPGTITITTVDGRVDEAYAALVAAVDA